MTKALRVVGVLLALSGTGAVYASEQTNQNLANCVRIDCNKHGAIITDQNGQRTYLGKNCDAYQPNIGSGSWWLTASAFAIEINGKASLLPYEVDCDLPACWHQG